MTLTLTMTMTLIMAMKKMLTMKMNTTMKMTVSIAMTMKLILAITRPHDHHLILDHVFKGQQLPGKCQQLARMASGGLILAKRILFWTFLATFP